MPDFKVGWMRLLRLATFSVWLALLAVAGTFRSPAALGAASPPPPLTGADFTHASSPHSKEFSTAGGHSSRFHLVIMVSFSDVGFPADVTPAAISRRAFGTYPSVEDYYRDQSTGNLFLLKASETDTSNGGAVDDGVVSVKVPMTRDEWNVTSPGTQNKMALQLADPSVDFAPFDDSITMGNQDGTIDRLELTISRIDARGALDTGGSSDGRGVTLEVDDVVLDGKHVNGDVRVSFIPSGGPLNLWIHEVAHQALDTDDLYGFGVGEADLMGTTRAHCFEPLSSYHRLHFGWGSTIPVTHDGYVSIPTYESSNTAFLLYDPSRGSSDYFLIENRLKKAGTYDTCADAGLVIFRVDDTKIKNNGGNDDVRPISLQGPAGETAQNCSTIGGRVNCCPAGCYPGGDDDAWDPADPRTPQRTMEKRPWRDGSPSNVAVRAIHARNSNRKHFDPTSNDIVAFFDVPGPGILVDAYALTQNEPTVTERQLATVNVQARNTGEATDSFTFSVDNLPPGWTAPPVTRTLTAGEDADIPIQIAAQTDQDDFEQEIVVIGRSTSDPAIRSPDSFDVLVKRPQIVVTINGPGPGHMNPTADTTPTFTFSANMQLASFQCSLDAEPLGPCTGPGQSHTQPADRPLALGHHVFHLQANTSDGRQVSEAREFDVILIEGGSTPPPPEPGTQHNVVRLAAGQSPTSGDDLIFGTHGNDHISASAGNDIVYGGAGNDTIRGGSGNDILYGGPGKDRLSGGRGNDKISGGSGSDRLYGRSGSDRLNGRAGRDRLSGGPGRDRLYGGAGRDYLCGGSGNDFFNGGPGNDRFHH